MSVLENVLVGQHTHLNRGLLEVVLRSPDVNAEEEAARERSLELLDFVGLTRLKDMPAANLSYGQKKLLEFAFVLIAEPQVILLDEPAGGINPTLINQLAERIRTLNTHGVTFLVVEHNMEFVMGLCETVFVLDHGEKIAEGSPGAIQADARVIEAYFGR